jgi:hypothetical protein
MLSSVILFVPNYTTKPPLTADDEEYAMLLEVCEEFEKQKADKTASDKYGKPTEIVIRNHLAKRGLNLSIVPKVTVQASKIENDLLLLKPDMDPNQKTYRSNQVKMVIEVKNSGVPAKTLQNGKQEDPNKALRTKFNELEATINVHNFAVIVLSETLLPPEGPYKWRFKEDAIKKENCKVFTLVARQLYPAGGLYNKINIAEMLQKNQLKKTEEFPKLLNYLKCL